MRAECNKENREARDAEKKVSEKCNIIYLDGVRRVIKRWGMVLEREREKEREKDREREIERDREREGA